MKQVAGLISTYSSDEFGICSALFELGGMVVMHDASGCNSTYTTHDEPRWYDMDSMIFISAISESEAIMGDDDKFIRDLIETAGELHPEFIALVGAPIPYMIGTDLDAIAAVVSRETGLPCFGFPANGMHHYTTGVSMALKRIVEEFAGEAVPGEKEKKRTVVNILGATPLDFSVNGSVDSMKQWIADHEMEMGVCLSMGCSLEDVRNLKEADVNLVVSYGGLAAAEVLEERFGLPYVVGVPFGETFSGRLAAMLKQSAAAKVNRCAYQKDPQEPEPVDVRAVIIGESVFGGSLAEAVEMDMGIPVRLLCPLDTEDRLLRSGDLETPEEDDLIREIGRADVVIADPLYRTLAEGKQFYELPHEAFSGRIYDSVNPDLIGKKIEKVRG